MENVKSIERLYYTRKEVSIITGISVADLFQMHKRGVGPRCFMPSGFSCSLYPIADTHAWLNCEGNGTQHVSNRGGARLRDEEHKPKGRPSKIDQVAKRKRVNAANQNTDSE